MLNIQKRVMARTVDLVLTVFGITLFVASLLPIVLGDTVFAADFDSLPAGEYAVEGSLSCYVNAMGGVEFGKPLLKEVKIVADGSGNCILKLNLGKSSVTIYSVTCDTFVDISPSYQTEDRGVKSGTLGFYENGALRTEGVTHTLSGDTALNASNEAVHYVDSISFPLTRKSGEYRLTLYINSNVMGVQFCEKNDRATATTYPAVLTVNWDTLAANINPNTNTNPNAGESVPATRAPETGGEPAGSAAVVEEDGLNIYYANGKPADAEPTYTAYINTQMMIALSVCACVLIAAGIVLLAAARKAKKETGEVKA
jgi:hypothetical protein